MASPALSGSVERLKRRYLRGGARPAGDCLSGSLQTKCKKGNSLTNTGNLDSSSDNTIMPLSIHFSQSRSTQNGRKHYSKPLSDLFKSFKNLDCFDDELDSLYDSSQLELEEEVMNVSATDAVPNTVTYTYTETDVTLPSNLAANTVTFSDHDINSGLVRKIVSKPETQVLSGQRLIPSHINQIYDELYDIHQKLQQENSAQQEYALQLQKREHFLAEREALLFKHEAALTKIRGVEEEVHAKFQIIKEQHEAEVKQLSETLKEKTKESKRLKSSFDTLKEMNDSLKKQLSDVSEQNKKMEVQARKVQARLENLQRKHEFLTIQKSKDVSQAMQEIKSVKQEKMTVTSKICKGPLNSHVYELLTVLMDWISDQFLKVKIEEEGRDNQTLTYTHKNYTQEKCAKLLPIVAEQLQWMPFVNPKLHMPVIKFIYWAIRQLNCGTQHSTMTSTMRRLGEDIFKGIGTKGNQHGSSEQPAESKPKIAAFFKSSILPLRFVSTLIVLKTVTQGLTKGTKHLTRGRIRKQDFSNVKGGKFLADYLAQAFDSLCVDLKTDEGKALFLEYQSVPVILSHLRISNRGLLSNAIDGLLQMTMESGFLQPFLEACSNESFFRTCSVLLRNPKLDLLIVEKLSIILQKLSRIKSNKKMFELFTIHLMIQELQRTTHPNHAFLCINLNSILFNLGLTRTNSLISSLSTSH
ncbi:coiled-coil domain-containing protein 138 isoform X2 [Gopherus flavomarginatus]|uniref:coiled-coil domain-containing protein 138 isoform X2 n=1 Tax=Gopherus flavomarginatus TaxID=286002 RepID=UPI0021CB9E4C|nr:coiled-coil domain-containing protein 138 isoform X2 [Gopherus flavomarginatus]